MPKPEKTTPKALKAVEIRARMREVKGWRVVATRDAHGQGGKRVELARTFEFGEGKPGFARAVRFMASLAGDLNRVNHHPRWENEWVNLRVWLTTHDAGFRLTAKDFDVATLIARRFRVAVGNRWRPSTVKATAAGGKKRRAARGRRARG